MKNILITTGILSSILIAGPIHDKLDPRLMGKSFGGNLDDNIANEDGLGTINLQHHTGQASINNELKIQAILKKIEHSTPDIVDKTNLKSSLLSGLIGTVEEKEKVENIELILNESNNNSGNLTQFCLGDPIGSKTANGYLVVDRDMITTMISNIEDITKTCTSNITDMSKLFSNKTTFNQNINHWDVSNVTNMFKIFFYAKKFNQPLDNWDVSNVKNMYGVFQHAYDFNQNINNWDVSNATDMRYLFYQAYDFNQPLDNWDVSMAYNMDNMFMTAKTFNQNINNWNINAYSMRSMFAQAIAFNQPLDNWDVSNVKYLGNMVNGATSFYQDISMWDTLTARNTINGINSNFDTSSPIASTPYAPLQNGK